MSSRFKFQLAEVAEDGALRAILREVPMPGDMSLAFHREPSFFGAESAGNISSQTLVYKDLVTNKILGVGGRSIRMVYVDSNQKTVGYLSMLRLLPEVRNSTVLVRGYRYLHDLHGDGDAPYYLTSILNENVHAQRILESGRMGLPTYAPVGTLTTYLIPFRKKMGSAQLSSQVMVCSRSDLFSAHKCLNRWNSRYQFAPSYTLNDIRGETRLLPHFSPGDLYVYKDRNEVLGTLGVWNQQPFKQTVVTGYSMRLKLIGPLYNGLAYVKGQPLLPGVGSSIRSVYASFLSSEADNPEIFESLLTRACSDWSEKGHDYLLVGLCEGNKLESVASKLARRTFKSKIYLVHWQEEKVSLPQKSLIPHLEVATL